MKKVSYIFSFKNFILKFILIFLFFYFLQSIILNEIFKNSQFRLNKLFSGNYNNVENIILGNSRSYSISFYPNNKKILNFSFNEMTFQNLLQILNAIEKKSNRTNIYIEITSLIDEEYNCSYHTFISHKFFEFEKLKEECKMEYYLSSYIPFFRINSDLFYRSLYYYFYPSKDQSYKTGDIYERSICLNNKQSFYNFTQKSLNSLFKKLDLIKSEFPSLKINFFILPYHKVSNILIKNLELILNENYNNKEIFINQNLNQNFFDDCENFLDRIHISEKGILEIDFVNKL